MTDYSLLIGDRSYSSWSLRGWLAFRAFGIDVSVSSTRLDSPQFADDLASFSATKAIKTVPVVKSSDGSFWTDSLAIVEELHSRHPNAGLLPSLPADRAHARSMMAEMHSGFATLRQDCPMNTRLAYTNAPISPKLQADLDRIEHLWSGRHSEWLFGDYSAADAFFAPVAARIAGYSLPVSDKTWDYVAAHLAHIPFRQFRAIGLTYPELDTYKRDYSTAPWPTDILPLAPTDATDSENALCPYSGKPPNYYLKYGDRVFGFCNERCRDKTVYDGGAWPEFLALVHNK